MLDPRDIDAVVFDMGGVFIIPHHEAMAAALSDAGVDLVPDADDAHRAHYTGVRGITDRLDHGEVREADLDVWSHYDRHYYSAMGVADHAIESVVHARRRQREGNRVLTVWRLLLDHNIEAFGRIADELPVAIVSNNDGTAEQQCREFGICQVGEGELPAVATVVDSGVLGIAKPDPRIFDPALEALGTERARTLYVGDTVHADVHGAEAAGLPVVQLDPLDLHDDHEHWRLPDLVALASHLLA